MDNELGFTQEEIQWVREIVQEKRRKQEFHNKMCEGLMQYYASEDWQKHVEKQLTMKKFQMVREEMYKSDLKEWQSLPKWQRFFTKKPKLTNQ